MFHANTNDGLYLPFSKFPIVSLRTPTNFAKSSCFISYFALYSLMRFLIILCSFSFFPFQNDKCNCKHKNGYRKTQSKCCRNCFCSAINISADKHKRNKRNHFRHKSKCCSLLNIKLEKFIWNNPKIPEIIGKSKKTI